MLSRLNYLFRFVILIFSLFVPLQSTATQSTSPDKVQICLGCHGNKDFSVELKNGEKLSLFVNEDSHKNSVHGVLECSGCHSGFSAEKHPGRVLKNKREYTVSGSELCRDCHIKFKSALHSKMADMAKKGGKVCVDCHGAHSVQPVSKAVSKDSEY